AREHHEAQADAGDDGAERDTGELRSVDSVLVGARVPGVANDRVELARAERRRVRVRYDDGLREQTGGQEERGEGEVMHGASRRTGPPAYHSPRRACSPARRRAASGS